MNLEEPRHNVINTEDKQKNFKDNTHMENLSNALVSFLSLSKQVQRPITFSLEKMGDIETNGLTEDLITISNDIFSDKKDESRKKLKSLREFIKETAPKHWSVAVMQESLKHWIEGLKTDYGIELDFTVEVVFNTEKNLTFLKINESTIRLYSIQEWENLLDTFRKNESWKEISNDDMIETKGLNNVKYLEAAILNSINKNKQSYLHEVLWLAYKTSEQFIMFKNETENNHRAFLKEGDFLSSIEF